VVPATTKAGDARRWLDRLGAVDALVVTDAAASGDPGTALGLGIPVALLDGRPADAAAWTGLLTARLAAP